MAEAYKTNSSPELFSALAAKGGILRFAGVHVSDKDMAFIAEVKGAAGIT